MKGSGGMNWKVTAALGALLAFAAVAYLLYTPPTAALRPEEKKLLGQFPGDRLFRIVLARPGEDDIVLERQSQGGSLQWRLVKPIDRPVDGAVVQQMVWGIDRFSSAGSLAPGEAAAAPALTGLDRPRLVVTFQAEGRQETLKFGKSPQTNASAVFFQREGDPQVYLAMSDTFSAYDKTVQEVRAKTLVQYEPFRAVRVELEYRFDRGVGGGQLVPEYEKTVFERFEQGKERGWFMTSPWKERVDDVKVGRLVADLPSLPIEDFQPPGDPKTQGFDDPQVRVAVTLNGIPQPVRVRFGGLDASKKRVYVQAEGTGEVALLKLERFEELPRQRSHFRSDAIYPFLADQLRSLTVEAPRLGKVVLERRETRTRRGEEELVTATWEAVEPKGVPVEPNDVERFVEMILSQRIRDFMGSQPDLKLFRLDPADAVLTAVEKSEAKHVWHWGLVGEDGYLRREGRDEIYKVRGDFVRTLLRLELNYRHPKVFDVPRDSLREFGFELKTREQLGRTYYKMRLDEKEKKWVFADPAYAKEKPDPERVRRILGAINYIQAERYISRDPERAAYYRLLDREAPATLTITTADGRAVLYIGETSQDRMYYARFEGSPVIFQITDKIMEALKTVPIEKPKPE